MARVNVEDEIETDPRFKALARRLGCEDRARGMLVRFWRLAQKLWGQEKELVPRDLFDLEDLGLLLDVGLAEDRPTGVYAKGAEERFAWYLAACRRARKGVEARAAKNNSAGNRPVDRPVDQKGDQLPTLPVKPPAPAPAPAPALTPALESVTPNGVTRVESEPRPPRSRSKAPPKTDPHPDCTPFDHATASRWATYARSVSRTVKPDPRWADTVRLLRTADGFAEADITAMLEHAEDSTSWWHKLAASLPAMRSRSGNGKLKAENLLESARRATEGEGGGIDWDAVGREDPA